MKLPASLGQKKTKAIEQMLEEVGVGKTLVCHLFDVWHCVVPCTMSKKTSKIILVITTSNRHQIGQFLAQRWQAV